jgi:predicted O-methyltransferase YrrM
MANHYKTGHFVEIGSFQGNSSAFMAVEIINSGNSIKFDCIDKWDAFARAGLHLKDQEKYPVDIVYKLFLQNTEPVRNYINPIRMASEEAVHLYPDQSLDFVFIDSDHSYEGIKADLQAWYPKMRKGGHIAGHDYVSDDRVKRAVDEFFNCTFDTDDKHYLREENCWCYYVQ